MFTLTLLFILLAIGFTYLSKWFKKISGELNKDYIKGEEYRHNVLNELKNIHSNTNPETPTKSRLRILMDKNSETTNATNERERIFKELDIK